MTLKDVLIRNAKPKTKLYRLFDGGGLYLEVSPAGGKYWRYKYRYIGKEKRLALGVYPDISLADARELHGKARKALSLGKDPGEAKKEVRRQAVLKSGNTFEAIAREWHASRLHKWTPKHAAKLLRRLEADVFPTLGAKPIVNITPSELLVVLRKVENRGAKEVAHRLLQSCGQVFMYAVVTERAEHNPTINLRGALKPVKKANHAYLKAEELPEYLTKLENYDGELQTKLALKFLLLTFVRTGEIRGATWKEINFDKAEWRIPAERMKMRDPHIVSLSTQALSVLRELKIMTGMFSFIFPNQHKPSGCMSENTMLYALYRMGYHSRATGHGFRSTASTILNHCHPVSMEWTSWNTVVTSELSEIQGVSDLKAAVKKS